MEQIAANCAVKKKAWSHKNITRDNIEEEQRYGEFPSRYSEFPSLKGAHRPEKPARQRATSMNGRRATGLHAAI
jgi:hypothetical protein